MVPKKDAMYIGNLNELDEALQKSFSAVKRDIEDLNSRLRMLQSSIIDIQKYLTNMQSDYVTIDKLNALKIKLADVNEEIKRLYRLEEAFKLLQERTIEKQKFEMLKKKIDGFDKLQKTAVTEDKLKQLATEVSDELSQMAKRLDEFDKKGGAVIKETSEEIKKELDQRFISHKEDIGQRFMLHKEDVDKALLENKKDINKKIIGIIESINNLRNETQNFITKSQINNVLRQINAEFDAVKEGLNEIESLKKDIKIIRRDKVSKISFDKNFEEMAKRIEIVERNNAREIASLKKQLQKIKLGKTGFNFMLFANILIVLSFLLLGVSAGLYFYGKGALMNYFIAGAIASFFIGILTRIIIVIRG